MAAGPDALLISSPLPEMGIPESDLPMPAGLAFQDPQSIGNPRDLTLKSYEQIYRSCFR